MPGDIKRVKGGYRVKWGDKVRAKRTSKRKAKSQTRLLRAVKHGWKPTGNSSGWKEKVRNR